jgi:hypothetical protein
MTDKPKCVNLKEFVTISSDGHLEEVTLVMHITNMNSVKPILNFVGF